MEYLTRQASEADKEWTWSLFKSLLKDSINRQWGWDEAYQLKSFDENLPIREFFVITLDTQDVGTYSFVEEIDHIHLKMILVDPMFQNKGVGTAVISKLKEIAAKKSLPIRLGVIKANPVVEFYTGQGFSVLDASGDIVQLQWLTPL